MSFFAPLYFVSIGLTINFLAYFDWSFVAFIIAIACVIKISAVLLGAWMAGMPLDRKALAIGFGLNARGATGIILAGVGFSCGFIDQRIFVAIITMALATSLMAGPMTKLLLKDLKDL